MYSRPVRITLFYFLAASLLLALPHPGMLARGLGRAGQPAGIPGVAAQAPASTLPGIIIYSQPPSPTGGLIHSSQVANPNGSDSDQFVWDDFSLASARSITKIQWRGGFDPARGGTGGPVTDFVIGLYASLQGGSQPDLVNPPLLVVHTGGNAGQQPAGTTGGIPMYSYQFILPSAFQAAGGVKYWLQIEAVQTGLPDWGLEVGTGGNSTYFRRYSSVGDVFYQIMHGSDASFSLLSPGVHGVWLPCVMRSP